MIQPAYEQPRDSRQVCWLPMDQIHPRTEGTFADARPALSLSELTASIQKYGLMQPIIVRPMEGGCYEILSGNRRYLACRMAGFSHIDAVILPTGCPGGSLARLLEALLYGHLHFFEEARLIESLIHTHGLSQEEIARQWNRSVSSVANKVRLLKLEAPLRALILEEGLSERHARALLRLPSAQGRMRVARKAAAQQLSVRDTELLVDSALSRLPAPPPPDRRVISLVRDHRLYLNAVQGIVSQMQEAGLDASCQIRPCGSRLQVILDLPASHPRR